MNTKIWKYKFILSGLFFCFSRYSNGQINPSFFPDFQAYNANPVIHYGDGFADASWNDPSVVKHNGQYIMYATAAIGINISDSNTVKVFRHVSADGYNWTLSPATPVLQPLSGTYYAGGTETPSVVIKNGIYHMYLTCYPPGNDPYAFVIAHATSTDGINWIMDATPVLESDGSNTMYGDLVGEPGAMVYNDSIYLFFTAAGNVNGQALQSIALMKSGDGTNFNTPQIAVQLPQDVYPLTDNYWGLSTPSALAINDTIYLFTDVAKTINGIWTQVALHQFKSLANSGVWFHDTIPLHTMQDFAWTDGEYLSSLLAPTPLMDDNGLLRIWYSGYHLADVNGVDTTYNIVYDSLGMLHVDPDFWGIGTSSFQFPFTTNASSLSVKQSAFQCYPNPANQFIYIRSSNLVEHVCVCILDITSRIIFKEEFRNQSDIKLDVQHLASGSYFVNVITDSFQTTTKIIVQK